MKSLNYESAFCGGDEVVNGNLHRLVGPPISLMVLTIEFHQALFFRQLSTPLMRFKSEALQEARFAG